MAVCPDDTIGLRIATYFMTADGRVTLGGRLGPGIRERPQS